MTKAPGPMLEIKKLSVSIHGAPILRNSTSRLGPAKLQRSWGRTAPEVDALLCYCWETRL